MRDIKKYFPIRTGFFSSEKSVKAVDAVSFDIPQAETLGLVGESGCGKTTLGRVLLNLITPDSGSVHFLGEDIYSLSRDRSRELKKRMQIVFQNPLTGLNPKKTIRYILSQPLQIHEVCRPSELNDRVCKLLTDVGMEPPRLYLDRYPHQLSGGQRQRVGIARAISTSPSFIVADEPVSSLDVSVRTQILALMKGLQDELGLTLLFITHDLSVLRSISQRVAVMYLGRIVEMAGTDTLFRNPRHPYTEALLSATPIPDPERSRRRRRIILKGAIPSPVDIPTGCRFHTRCQYHRTDCSQIEPQLEAFDSKHYVACRYPLEGYQ